MLMGTSTGWLLLSVLLRSGAAVSEAPPAPETTAPIFWWSAADAQRGVSQVHSAHPLMAQELVLQAHAYLSIAHSLLLPDDRNTLQEQIFALTYGCTAHLQLAVNYKQRFNSNTAYAYEETRSLGDPQLAMLYGDALTAQLHLAGLLSVVLPTDATGLGLSLQGATVAAQLLATLQLAPWAEGHLNAGYVLDGRNKVFAGLTLNREQAFAGGVPVSNRFSFGLALATLLPVNPSVALGPFAALSGAWAPTAQGSENPLLLTAGLKLTPDALRRWEFGSGFELALSGAPRPDDVLPGLPPWGVFVQLGVHFGQTTATQTPGLLEASATPTFVLHGTLQDSNTKQPLPGVVVTLSSFPQTHYITDAQGNFSSTPLYKNLGKQQIRLAAPDYGVTTLPFTPSLENPKDNPKDPTVPLQINWQTQLRRLQTPAEGVLQATVLDDQNGQPVTHGFMYLPADNRKLRANVRGGFILTLPAGQHQVVFYAAGYITQRKDISLERDAVMIFNVDLHPLK